MHTANSMMDTVPHIVHVIADLSDITQLPPHIFANFQRIIPLLHKRSGQVVIIHQNRLFNAVYGVLKRIAHPLAERFILVDSIEMAESHLQLRFSVK